jgi:two-component system, response regulator PdtaR
MKSVLIVEDEIFVAMDIERILAEAGYRVAAIAADQHEAISAAEDVQLAFVDLNLRDGATGPDIAHYLAQKHGIRIVYVTANPAQIGQPADTAVAYIRKPFSDAAILAAAALAGKSGPGEVGHEDVILL